MTSNDTWATTDTLRHRIAFGYKLTEAIDKDVSTSLSVTDSEESIRDGSLFLLLEARVGENVDFTVFDDHARELLAAALHERAGTGQQEHQTSIQRNGLCALLALTLSAIGYISASAL